MRKASAPRKLSPDVSRRLSDSRRESVALTLREIHCPFCSFLVEAKQAVCRLFSGKPRQKR